MNRPAVVPENVRDAIERIAVDSVRFHYDRCVRLHAELVAADKIDPNWSYFCENARKERQRKVKKRRS